MALVAYNAYFADGSNFSKREYLEKIVYDAMAERTVYENVEILRVIIRV
jgi:hypothetical protein